MNLGFEGPRTWQTKAVVFPFSPEGNAGMLQVVRDQSSHPLFSHVEVSEGLVVCHQDRDGKTVSVSAL